MSNAKIMDSDRIYMADNIYGLRKSLKILLLGNTVQHRLLYRISPMRNLFTVLRVCFVADLQDFQVPQAIWLQSQSHFCPLGAVGSLYNINNNKVHFAKLAFGLAIYYFVLLPSHQPLDQVVQKYSQIFCVLDSVSTMLLQGVLLIIPFIWYFPSYEGPKISSISWSDHTRSKIATKLT